MNCPVCKSVVLSKTTLEANLPAHTCGQCGGQRLCGKHYYQWLDRQPAAASSLLSPAASETLLIHDSADAKLCPECGRFLTRYKVGHGVDFCIDRCACGGIWLDACEWESLRAHNLHNALHHVFSAAWQADLRRQEQQQRIDHLLTEKLGAADYAELQRLKSWLDDHVHRNELYAYLLHQQPAAQN